MISKPTSQEYPVFYDKYIQLVNTDVIHFLKKQQEEILELSKSIDEQKSFFRYSEGKWSIRELFCHCTDTERIMAYRALCFARNEKAVLPGYEEDEYIKYSDADKRTLESHILEFNYLRNANITLFQSFSNEASERMGVANNREVSVRALIHIIAGHTQHHINILRERYLV